MPCPRHNWLGKQIGNSYLLELWKFRVLSIEQVPLGTLKVWCLIIHWAGTSWNFESLGSHPRSKYLLELWKSRSYPLSTKKNVGTSWNFESLGSHPLSKYLLELWKSRSYPLTRYLLELWKSGVLSLSKHLLEFWMSRSYSYTEQIPSWNFERPGSYPLSRYILELWKSRVLSTEQVARGTLKVERLNHWAGTSWNFESSDLIHWAGTSWNFESLGSCPLSRYWNFESLGSSLSRYLFKLWKTRVLSTD